MRGVEGGVVFDSFADVLSRRLRGRQRSGSDEGEAGGRWRQLGLLGGLLWP
jgi:hypothetical protein